MSKWVHWLLPLAAALLFNLTPTAADTSKRCEDAFARANHYMEAAPPNYPAAIESYNALLADCPGFDRGDAAALNLSAAYLRLSPPQFDKAIKALQDGIRNYPHSGQMVDLQVALGMAYIADADHLAPLRPDEAKSLYSTAVETLQKVQGQVTEAQSRWQVQFNLANARFNLGDYSAAVVSYHRLLETRPPAEISIPALYNSGSASLNLADAEGDPAAREAAYSQAAEAFHQLLDGYPRAPNAAEAQLQLARTELRQMKTEPALRLLKSLTAAAERSIATSATYELAMFEVSQHQYQDALPLLQRYVQDAGGTPEADSANVQIGYILMTQKGDREGALAAYRAAAAGDSPPAALQGQRGEMAIAAAYMQDQQFQKAAAVYQSLVHVPDLKLKESAMYGQALSLINLKDPGAARASAEYLQAFPLSGGAASIMYQLGVEQFNNHDYVPAMSSFSQAAAVNPEGVASPEAKRDAAALKSAALYWAGTAAWQAQQTRQAADYWEQELKSDPACLRDLTGDTLLSLARADAADGRYSDAVARIQLALQHFPGKPAASDTLLEIAGLASTNNHPEAALQIYTELIAAVPLSTSAGTAQYNLGVTYLKMNPPEPDKALKAFQDYLTRFSASPNAPATRFNLAILEYNMARIELARLKKGAASAADISARKQVEVDFLKAAADFETALAAGASSVPAETALYYQARAYMDGQQPTRALLISKRLLKAYPESAHAAEAAALIAALSKQLGTAGSP